MKKILFIFMFIFSIFTFNIFANDLVSFNITYDGKTETYSAQKVYININGTEVESQNMQPIILEDRVLVPLRFIAENLGAEVDWEPYKKEVIITYKGDTLSFIINNEYATKNGDTIIDFDVAAKIINDYTMVPVRAISEAFGYNVMWSEEERTVYITDIGDMTEMEQYIQGIIEEAAATEEFIQEDTEIITEDLTETTTEEVDYKEDGLKIVWDQISSTSGNYADGKFDAIEGLDVIVPTWFEITDTNGTINDKGSEEYAKWAKEQGYQLWALISNSFDADITHAVLSDSTKRTKLINDIIALAQKYDLDGINIDFESIAKTDGDYYLLFIQEAAAAFRENGLVTSVDMYVPTEWTKHYQMAEVAKVVDYVIIMAYDEHYSTSTTSGSVSSIPWADTYMAAALELVDKDKLIMGIPFYTRIWTETQNADGTVSVVSKSLKMDEAIQILLENDATIYYDETTGQNYGEYYSDGTTKKIWLEDETSVQARMEIARKYDLKGIAAWKRGHEKEGIWDIINKYFK